MGKNNQRRTGIEKLKDNDKIRGFRLVKRETKSETYELVNSACHYFPSSNREIQAIL